MSVLVTGAAGYIGRATIKALDEPHVGADLKDHPKVYQVNILDTDKLVQLMDLFKVTKVIHLAALISVPESVKYPVSYYENNVSGTVSVLKACKVIGVDRLVFASSAAAARPCSPYGYTKSMCEQMIRDSKIPAIVLRYYNVGGGEMNYDSHLLVNRIARAAAGHDPALKVYGDGSQVRDYVHVDDVAEANVRALRCLRDSDELCSIWDIGSGIGSTVKEVIAASDKPISVNYERERQGDPQKLVSNVIPALWGMGWKSKRNLKEIVNSVEWRKP